MIRNISIERLRGIARGKLGPLAPLTVLVGPNGCGKSTVLEALLLATTRSPSDAAGRVVWRRREFREGLSWLLHGPGEDGAAVVEVESDSGYARRCKVTVLGGQVRWEVAFENGTMTASADFSSATGGYKRIGADVAPPVGDTKHVRLIDPVPGAFAAPLDVVFSEAVQHGFRRQVNDLLSGVVPGLQWVEILSDSERRPVVHIVFEWGSVPLALAGDGVLSLARLCIELASVPAGLALVEEPEAHQHPRAVRQSARALVEATRRGIQVVLSTHSLELIDELGDALGEEEKGRLTVFRLALHDGELVSSGHHGDEVAFVRRQLEDDLR